MDTRDFYLNFPCRGARGIRNVLFASFVYPRLVEPLIATAADRPDLFRRGSELTRDIWPVYNTHGEVLSVYWGRLAEEWLDLKRRELDALKLALAAAREQAEEIVEEHAETPYGQRRALDLQLAGQDQHRTLEGLPVGIDEVVERGFDPGAPGRQGTLSGLAVEVPRRNQGRGLSRHVIGGMRSVAARHGMDAVIVPVRPLLKERYPLVPIERYVEWTRPDGSPFDPWIRVHTGLGAAVLKPAPRSLKIVGRVEEWEAWTQMDFPESGDYVIPQGLALLSVDRVAGIGTYFEPNIWIRHRV